MHITITGRKVNLKNNFKELVEKKLSRYDRIFEENADAHVVVTVEHNRQTVEITIRQSGLIFRADFFFVIHQNNFVIFHISFLYISIIFYFHISPTCFFYYNKL